MPSFRVAAAVGTPLLALIAACGASSLDLSSSPIPRQGDASTDASSGDAGHDAAADAGEDADALPPNVNAPIRPHSLALDDDAVYFSDGPTTGGALKRYSRRDSTVSTLYVPEASRLLVWPIAKDAARIYFATSDANLKSVSSIYSIPIGCGAPTKLWDVAMFVTDIAIDATNLYWTGFSRTTRDPDAGPPEAGPDGGIDEFGKFTAFVMQAPLAGGDPVERYREARREAMNVAVDATGLFVLTADPEEYVSYRDSSEGTLTRIAPNGDLAIFAAHLAHPRAIAARAGSVFWIDEGTPREDCNPDDGTLMRADAPGASRAIQSGLAGTEDVATDDAHIYLSNLGGFCNIPSAVGSVLRIAFDGTSPETIASDLLEPGGLATFGGALAYTADGRIYVVKGH